MRSAFRVMAAVLVVVIACASIATGSGTPIFVSQWGSQGTGPLNFNGPTGIHVGPDGLVYVADNGNRRIKVFTNEGSFVREWLSTDGVTVDRPWDVAVGAANMVYVTGTGNRVLQFTHQGALVRGWGSHGFCDGEFYMPVGIDADASGDLYVSDFGNHRVQKFSADGDFIMKWGAPNAPCAPPSEEVDAFQPVTIATDALGRVHVIARTTDYPSVEFSAMETQTFSSDGQLVDSWTLVPGFIGVVEPFGIAINAAGETFIADPMTHRVRWFDADGNVLGTVGTFGYGPGHFFDPRDVALDADGDLFVLDAGNNRVQKFTFATTGVPLDGGAIALRAWPNPARGQVSLEFELSQAARCEVGVFDLSGRRVALLDDTMRPAGRHRLEWNATTDDGSLAAPGVYLYRVNAGGHIRTGRVAILNPGD